jgi:hypothetical protein
MLLSLVGILSVVFLFAAVLMVLLVVVGIATALGAWWRYVASDGNEDEGRYPEDL